MAEKKKIGCGCLAVIAVAAVLGIIGSNSNSSDKTDNDVNITPPNQNAAAENTNTPSTENETVTEETPGYVEVGGSFEKDGVKFTVNSANTNYQVQNDTYGFYKPDDGYKYLAVSFTFENTSNRDKYVSIYDFDCYADNTKCEQEYISADTKNDFVNANISPGRNVSFTTFYSVPANAGNIELEYTSNLWTNEKIIVKIQ